MSRKLTILFAPVEGVGHVNACIGLAEALQSRGHDIVFVVDQTFKGKLSPFGFTEELFESGETDQMPGEKFARYMLGSGLLSDASPLQKMKIMQNMSSLGKMIATKRSNEPKLKAVIDKYRPDLYVLDDIMGSPTLIHSSKPWVAVCSMQPLYVFWDERTPPPGSGFPSKGDRSEWKEFRKESSKSLLNAKNDYNEWMREEGFPTIEIKNAVPLKSPFLNIYGYPEELDYTDIRPIPEKWLRVDTFMRRGEKQEFKIPD
ncbi:unnamed protein product, partial [Medioppia subpectinata]